jgi:hypothetical protein
LVREHLKIIDLAGYWKMRGRICAIVGKSKKLDRMRKGLPNAESRTQDLAIVEQKIQGQPGIGKVSVVSLGGFKRLLAASLAIYRPEEVAAFAGMELSSLNSLVTVDEILASRKMIPEAIRALADQMVLRDLHSGNITNQTEVVDKISARRTKLAIEAHKEMRETEKEDEVTEKKREADIKKRFGVDRGTGYIEVKE